MKRRLLGSIACLCAFALLWNPGPVAADRKVAAPASPVIGAVGDIACNSFPWQHKHRCRYNKVSELLYHTGIDRFLALGDLQYLHGSLKGFRTYYGRWFGRVKNITAPAPGNHETYTRFMRGYMTYFGKRANPPFGYYSFNLGGWHVIALNSQLCKGTTWSPKKGPGVPVVPGKHNEGCKKGDREYQWLQRDLARHPNSRYPCTLAYWHHALFKWSKYPLVGPHWTRPLWKLLYRAHADVVLNGHDHLYQRFAPQDPQANPDPNGITEFIVGTGGDTYQDLPPRSKPKPPNYVTGQDYSFGILRMTLNPTSGDYAFVSAPGQRTYTDSGTVTCH